ncbi:MAG: DUF5703 domain-containing protein [Bacteroidales bacterium]|jgi:hypothetical protein
MKKMMFIKYLTVCALAIGFTGGQAQESNILEKTAAYNVVWNTPSVNSLGSMPIGNGDIGMNVWVEGNGDLYLYLSKTDAWSENGQLLKLGKIRINLDPSPFTTGKPFRQELKLTEGKIMITAGKPAEQVEIGIRIDANHPVGEINITSRKPVKVKVELQSWRTEKRAMTNKDELFSVYGLEAGSEQPIYQEADHFIPASGNRITWYHRNDRSVWKENLQLQALGEFADRSTDPLFYRTFGATIEGTGLISGSATVLASQGKISACTLSVYPLTSATVTEQNWVNQLNYGIERIKSIPSEMRIRSHLEWWNNFWNRSYIFLSSPDPKFSDQTKTITQGYILQRFINACGGRGQSPIKFNGSIFTVDTYARKESKGFDADFRRWGGPFWFQNTRLPYWSMLESGDFEMMKPLFAMYLRALPIRQFATKKYYGHAGAFYPETMNFWGTWTNVNYGTDRKGMPDGLTENTYIRYYWTGGLELSLMMIDYYEFTRSEVFAKDTLLPFVTEILEFFDKHWRRDIDGKILFTPAQALETYQTVVNPTPDIAGLRFVTCKMLEMKGIKISPEKRKQWESLLSAIPEIPLRIINGDKVIAPAALAAQEANIENPGLYAVFPFRVYGVGKPDIDLGISTFVTRKFRSNIGWQHSSIQAAYLGLAREASELLLDKFSNHDPECRFPAFWGPNYDWSPDQDHGCVAMIALQRMLLQYEGDSVTTFPAWPEGWDVEFRLSAPGRSVVEGTSVGGKKDVETLRL